ncbi:MAG: hypothetical protein RIT28_1700 [Pseudomonadota bacterium]
MMATFVPYNLGHAGAENDLAHCARSPRSPLEEVVFPHGSYHSRVDGDVLLSDGELVASAVPGAELCAMDGGRRRAGEGRPALASQRWSAPARSQADAFTLLSVAQASS